MNSKSLQDLRRLAATAIQLARQQGRWKPGKDTQHIEKRIRQNHLSPGTSLVEYNRLIQKILIGPESKVYHYPFGQADYFAIINAIEEKYWLVLIGTNGIMETAFPPDDLHEYIAENQYVFIGKIQELIP